MVVTEVLALLPNHKISGSAVRVWPLISRPKIKACFDTLSPLFVLRPPRFSVSRLPYPCTHNLTYDLTERIPSFFLSNNPSIITGKFVVDLLPFLTHSFHHDCCSLERRCPREPGSPVSMAGDLPPPSLDSNAKLSRKPFPTSSSLYFSMPRSRAVPGLVCCQLSVTRSTGRTGRGFRKIVKVY